MRCQQCLNVLPEFLIVVCDRSRAGHDHVELAGVKSKISQNFKPLFHVGHIVVFDSGYQVIFPRFNPEARLLKDVFNEINALEPSGVICGASLELKTDIVFPRSFADQGFNR